MDPRFKTLPFVDTSEKVVIKLDVISELTTFIELKQLASEDMPKSPEEPDPDVQPNKKKKLECFLEDIMGNSTNLNPSEPSEIASSEVERYYIEAPLPLTCKNPLTWWETRATQYVNLSELAKKTLCIPATSIPMQ